MKGGTNLGRKFYRQLDVYLRRASAVRVLELGLDASYRMTGGESERRTGVHKVEVLGRRERRFEDRKLRRVDRRVRRALLRLKRRRAGGVLLGPGPSEKAMAREARRGDS